MVKRGVLFWVLCLCMLFGVAEVKAAGAVNYHGKVVYGPTTVGNFSVNGKQAFCIEHVKPTPPTGTNFSEQIYEDANIRKVLYYGWNGPAQWNGFESEAHGVVSTSIVLSYYYSGSSVSSESRSFYNWLQSQPAVPDVRISLSKSSTEAYLTEDKSIQRTEEITFQAEAGNSITIALPEEVILYNVTKGTEQKGSVTVYGGDTFYLTAPLEMDGVWSSGAVKGSATKKYQPVVCVTQGDNLQNLSYGQWAEGGEDTVELCVKWIPHGTIQLQKEDAESGENRPQGSASLEGAVYEIYNTAGMLKETLTTDAEGTAVSESLPYDTYLIREIKASEGYLKETEDITCVLNEETVAAISKEQIIRADLRGVKIGDGSHKRMKNVPFRITSKTTGENHTVVTDSNGEFDSTGVWFGTGEKKEGRGSLFYDTYIIEEQRCEVNEGYELIPAFEVVIYRDNQTVSLGTLTDDEEQPETPKEQPGTPEEKPGISADVPRKSAHVLESVKTGDSQNLIVLILLLILSCAAMFLYGTMSRKIK